VGVWGHSLRSTFHRLHLLRLWTPTIFLKQFFNRLKNKINQFYNKYTFHGLFITPMYFSLVCGEPHSEHCLGTSTENRQCNAQYSFTGYKHCGTSAIKTSDKYRVLAAAKIVFTDRVSHQFCPCTKALRILKLLILTSYKIVSKTLKIP
jgi:hypothetical protein